MVYCVRRDCARIIGGFSAFLAPVSRTALAFLALEDDPPKSTGSRRPTRDDTAGLEHSDVTRNRGPFRLSGAAKEPVESRACTSEWCGRLPCNAAGQARNDRGNCIAMFRLGLPFRLPACAWAFEAWPAA